MNWRQLTTDRFEFRPSEHESAVENFESENNEDDLASDFIEASEEDTLEYVKQHRFKLVILQRHKNIKILNNDINTS